MKGWASLSVLIRDYQLGIDTGNNVGDLLSSPCLRLHVARVSKSLPLWVGG